MNHVTSVLPVFPVRNVQDGRCVMMGLVAIGTLIAAAFQIALRRNEHHWEESLVKRWTTKSLAILTLLIWVGVIILGRLIAYDHIWGAWSLAPKA